MPRLTRFSSLLVAFALLFAGLALVAPAANADTYNPPEGARINNPHGNEEARNRIKSHIVRSIYSVPVGGVIKIASWNIRSKAITDALVRVHRYKNITVRVIMQDENAYEHEVVEGNPIPAPGDANPDWWWMKRELAKYGNNTRPVSRRSWARLCNRACRGGGILAHSKLAIFSQVYQTPYVVQYGSGNLTDAAASIQWNDWYTINRSKEHWNFANNRFAEMAADRSVSNPYRQLRARGIQVGYFPWSGTLAWGDPFLRALGPVKCKGAASGFGTSSGRTIIRVSQTAIYDSRGKAVASRLKDLWNAGCDVKVLYTMMGDNVKGILRSGSGRGPIPIHQLATDVDGDWLYDRYLHQKVLTINGNYNTDTSTTLAYNGSVNMQNYSSGNDEIWARLSASSVVLFYQRWINTWFYRNARAVSGDSGSTAETREDNVPEELARKSGIDPYAKVQLH